MKSRLINIFKDLKVFHKQHQIMGKLNGDFHALLAWKLSESHHKHKWIDVRHFELKKCFGN